MKLLLAAGRRLRAAKSAVKVGSAHRASRNAICWYQRGLTTGRLSPWAQVRAATSRAKAAMMTATRT
jgi:hypothetical protein